MARNLIEHLSATAYLGKLEDMQLGYHLETYGDTDYAHKAGDRRSVSGVAVSCEGTIWWWFSGTQEVCHPIHYKGGVRSYDRRGEGRCVYTWRRF